MPRAVVMQCRRHYAAESASPRVRMSDDARRPWDAASVVASRRIIRERDAVPRADGSELVRGPLDGVTARGDGHGGTAVHPGGAGIVAAGQPILLHDGLVERKRPPARRAGLAWRHPGTEAIIAGMPGDPEANTAVGVLQGTLPRSALCRLGVNADLPIGAAGEAHFVTAADVPIGAATRFAADVARWAARPRFEAKVAYCTTGPFATGAVGWTAGSKPNAKAPCSTTGALAARLAVRRAARAGPDADIPRGAACPLAALLGATLALGSLLPTLLFLRFAVNHAKPAERATKSKTGQGLADMTTCWAA
jgi:hypothetical protein